jgi:hypothetical protein
MFVFTVCLVWGIFQVSTSQAEISDPFQSGAVLVYGFSDASQTYAIIRCNGIEYRTDQTGQRTNQLLWDQLSDDERMDLVRIYGWYLDRRQEAFGTVSADMADFYNDQAGWTALVEELKDRRMNKEYPRLRAIFGPDTVLNLPLVATDYPEVQDSSTYRKAKRLAAEIQEDYELGQKLYSTLTDANWEQVSVAVKGISYPLIKIIVDNFMTNFITHGSKPMSNLTVTVMNFIQSFNKFLEEKQEPGKEPPTPGELIERIEELLQNVEKWATQAADAVESKRSELTELVAEIESKNERITQERQQAGTAIVNELEEKIAEPPSATPISITSDQEPESYAYWADMNKQAMNKLRQLEFDARSLRTEHEQRIAPTIQDFNSAITPIDWPEPVNRFFNGIGTSFQDDYFETNECQSVLLPWTTEEYYQTFMTQRASSAAVIRQSITAANTFIDTALAEIDTLHSEALGLDQYQYWMGEWDDELKVPVPADWLSSESFLATGVRDLSSAVAVVGTPQAPSNATAVDLELENQIIAPAADALSEGQKLRQEWMQEALTRYENLRFNFENSLSLVMAVIDQFDALHANPPFIVWQQETYSGHTFYIYQVDIQALRDRIADQPTASERLDERLKVIEELRDYRIQELELERKLRIAQNAHLADATMMSNFLKSLAARYENPSYDAIAQDFKEVTGKDILLDQYTMYTNLIGNNFTYYYLGEPGSEEWVRTPEECRSVNMQTAMQLISGETHEYFLLQDLYSKMKVDKDLYLAMSQEEFDAFNTFVTKKIGDYPNKGEWIARFESDEVWSPEYPAQRLVYQTRSRQNWLISLYNGNTTSDYSAGISGTLRTSSGIPLTGVTMRLSGSLEVITRTDTNGFYSFEYLPSGEFRVAPQGNTGYQPQSRSVTFAGEAITADFIRPDSDENGYSIVGQVQGKNGKGLAGILVQLFTGEQFVREFFSDELGGFAVTGLEAGVYTLRLADQSMALLSADQEITVPAESHVLIIVDESFYAVQLTASPEAGGSISGGGTVKHGEKITVIALANAEYSFQSWTEEGQEVSTSAEYTFTVTSDRDLVANFKEKKKQQVQFIGSWQDVGTYYYDWEASEWIRLTSGALELAAGDLDADGRDDLIGVWSSGLWFQYAASQLWVHLSTSLPENITAADMTGNEQKDIVGSWPSGVYFWDSVTYEWIKISQTPADDLAAGNVNGNNEEDLVGVWSSGIWVLSGQTDEWFNMESYPPSVMTVGDMTGNSRDDIIGSWSEGLYYQNTETYEWVRLTSSAQLVAADDITGDGNDELIGVWPSGIWIFHVADQIWEHLTTSIPDSITTGYLKAGDSVMDLKDPLISEKIYIDLSGAGPDQVK